MPPPTTPGEAITHPTLATANPVWPPKTGTFQWKPPLVPGELRLDLLDDQVLPSTLTSLHCPNRCLYQHQEGT